MIAEVSYIKDTAYSLGQVSDMYGNWVEEFELNHAKLIACKTHICKLKQRKLLDAKASEADEIHDAIYYKFGISGLSYCVNEHPFK